MDQTPKTVGVAQHRQHELCYPTKYDDLICDLKNLLTRSDYFSALKSITLIDFPSLSLS